MLTFLKNIWNSFQKFTCEHRDRIEIKTCLLSEIYDEILDEYSDDIKNKVLFSTEDGIRPLRLKSGETFRLDCNTWFYHSDFNEYLIKNRSNHGSLISIYKCPFCKKVIDGRRSLKDYLRNEINKFISTKKSYMEDEEIERLLIGGIDEKI